MRVPLALWSSFVLAFATLNYGALHRGQAAEGPALQVVDRRGQPGAVRDHRGHRLRDRWSRGRSPSSARVAPADLVGDGGPDRGRHRVRDLRPLAHPHPAPRARARAGCHSQHVAAGAPRGLHRQRARDRSGRADRRGAHVPRTWLLAARPVRALDGDHRHGPRLCVGARSRQRVSVARRVRHRPRLSAQPCRQRLSGDDRPRALQRRSRSLLPLQANRRRIFSARALRSGLCHLPSDFRPGRGGGDARGLHSDNTGDRSGSLARRFHGDRRRGLIPLGLRRRELCRRAYRRAHVRSGTLDRDPHSPVSRRRDGDTDSGDHRIRTYASQDRIPRGTAAALSFAAPLVPAEQGLRVTSRGTSRKPDRGTRRRRRALRDLCTHQVPGEYVATSARVESAPLALRIVPKLVTGLSGSGARGSSYFFTARLVPALTPGSLAVKHHPWPERPRRPHLHAGRVRIKLDTQASDLLPDPHRGAAGRRLCRHGSRAPRERRLCHD